MFVNAYDNRFKMKMWCDSRLVNKQGVFCLCTKCIKENEDKGIECPIHKRFMQGTRFLNVTAPVFACTDFVEDPDAENLVEQLYEPMREQSEHLKALAGIDFADSWGEQKERWGLK
jgi:hypothetical protein